MEKLTIISKYLKKWLKYVLVHPIQVTVTILAFGLLFIFRDDIIRSCLVNSFFSKIPNNNILVGVWIFLILVGIYYWLFKKEKKCIYLATDRYAIETILFVITLGFFIYIYCDTDYSQDCFRFTYVFEIWVVILLGEILLRKCNRRNLLKNGEIIIDKTYPYITDSSTKIDDFHRNEYAAVLLKKIFATFNQGEKNEQSCENQNGAFVINISENYGYGKSSFLLLLKDQAKEYTDKDQMIFFEYKPWLCESPQKIINEFFKLLNENLSEYVPHIGKTINKYVRKLSEYYSSKNVLAYVVSNLFREQSSILKEREQLKDDLERLGKPIVVLIDDVDRLRDDELMTLFSLLRNTADFSNIYYILADDIDYLKQVLQRKGVKDQESYIKKFINFEFLLPGFDADILSQEFINIIRDILGHVKDNFAKDNQTFVEDTKNSIEHIFTHKSNTLFLPWNNIFTNIRDMKRFFNDYTMAIDCYINNNKENDGKLSEDIDLADLFAIELLKYLNEPIYKVLRDHDDLMIELIDGESKEDKSDPLRNFMRYKLKENYQKIIFNLYKNPKLETKIQEMMDHSIEKESNKEIQNNEEKTNKKENAKDATLMESCIKENKNHFEKLISDLLSYLFSRTYKVNENSLCYKDAYFRYFSYRFKNEMMTNNEFNRLMFDLSVDDYKKEIEKIHGKQNSFIHKLSLKPYYKNKDKDSLNVDFIKKIFIFLDDICNFNIEDERTLYEYYNVPEIISVWFMKSNYNGKNIDELRKDMSILILNDSHYLLIVLFLDKMNLNIGELTFYDSDVLYWCGLLLNQILKNGNEESFNDVIRIIGGILNRSILPDHSNAFIWLTFIVIKESGNFIWNHKYIECLYKNKNKLIESVKFIDPYIGNSNSSFEGINDVGEMKNDLLELLKMDDISKETIDKHPFLQYAISVKKKYQATKA